MWTASAIAWQQSSRFARNIVSSSSFQLHQSPEQPRCTLVHLAGCARQRSRHMKCKPRNLFQLLPLTKLDCKAAELSRCS